MSATPNTPSQRRPCRTTIGAARLGLQRRDGSPGRSAARRPARSSHMRRLPISTVSPSTMARTPRAVTLSRARRRSAGTASASARRTIASASGCCDWRSTAAATASMSAAVPSSGTTSVTSGRPIVSVPVLSTASARTVPSASSCEPPFTSTPCRAACAMPDRIAAGVPRASAQGDAATSRAMPR